MQIRRDHGEPVWKRVIMHRHDKAADAAYFLIRPGKVSESDEVMPGVIVDFDRSGKVIGVEILEFSKRIREISRILEKVLKEFGG